MNTSVQLHMHTTSAGMFASHRSAIWALRGMGREAFGFPPQAALYPLHLPPPCARRRCVTWATAPATSSPRCSAWCATLAA